VDDGVETTGVVVGWLDFAVVTCGYWTSVEASDAAAGVAAD
jgi:hypothetical protein